MSLGRSPWRACKVSPAARGKSPSAASHTATSAPAAWLMGIVWRVGWACSHPLAAARQSANFPFHRAKKHSTQAIKVPKRALLMPTQF